MMLNVKNFLKFATVAFLWWGTGAQAGEACMGMGAQVCGQANFDYHARFYSARRQGFVQSFEDQRMRSLVCRNFVLEGGTLQANFAFERKCNFNQYVQALNQHQITSCSDFLHYGADANFVANCREALDIKLGSFLSSRAALNIKGILNRARAGMANAFADVYYRHAVDRVLDNILSEVYVYRNLSTLKAEFISAKELCAKHNAGLCSTYRLSSKQTLSLGGYIFLSEEALETVITHKVAELVAESLHRELYGERLLTYMRFLVNNLDHSALERVIARSQFEDSLNKHTNTMLVLRKYYAPYRMLDDEMLRIRATYYCYEDPFLHGPRAHYAKSVFYSMPFDQLYETDQVELLMCSEERPYGPDQFLI